MTKKERYVLYIILAQLLFILVLVLPGHSQENKVSQMATAIARTEGFYTTGTIPNRYHNPGDLRASIKNAYPGQTGLAKHGYVVFKSDAWGWAALEKQIQMIIDGDSQHFDQSMTFAQIARIYAASPEWPKTLCKILKISPALTIQEYFGLAPRLLTTGVKHDTLMWLFKGRRDNMPVLREMPTLLAQVR
jgi:hypothetical protein